MPECSFCIVPAAIPDGPDLQNVQAYVREDKFLVSPDLPLVTPRRHAEDWFCLTQDEQAAITQLINQAKNLLDHRYSPAGYNIGWN